MIYTVTFNPSVDYVVRLSKVNVGGLNRTDDTEKYAGGKGINVSRVLKQLDTETTALGFCGGFTGQFIKDALESDGINQNFIEVEGDTRINIKLKTGAETEINAAGPSIRDHHISQLEAQLKTMTKDDHVVFAGSVPNGFDYLYQELADILSARSIPFTIDAEDSKLTSTLQYMPYLIKPNRVELAGAVRRELTSETDITAAAMELVEKGAQNVLVTLGRDGAIFVNKDYQYRIPSPKGILRNSVGAGDSTVAGFISRKDYSIEERIKYAIACGSATAFSDDLAQKGNIDALLREIEIQPI